jgi:hypothetical protein
MAIDSLMLWGTIVCTFVLFVVSLRSAIENLDDLRWLFVCHTTMSLLLLVVMLMVALIPT